MLEVEFPSGATTVRVFADGPGGGNPAPIVLRADGWTEAAMKGLATASGHESGFVLMAPPDSGTDFVFRFWVPEHEMSMCVHASIGAVWLLDRASRLPARRLVIGTRSGSVEAEMADERGKRVARVAQPAARVDRLRDDVRSAVADALLIRESDLADRPIMNATTSWTKTLVPLVSCAVLDALTPDVEAIPEVCDRISSTGLYPWAVRDAAAREF